MHFNLMFSYNNHILHEKLYANAHHDRIILQRNYKRHHKDVIFNGLWLELLFLNANAKPIPNSTRVNDVYLYMLSASK